MAVLNVGSTVGVGMSSLLRSGDFSWLSSLALEFSMILATGLW